MAENYKKYSEEEAREIMGKILKVGFNGAILIGKLACKGIHYATRPKNEEDEYPTTKLGKMKQIIYDITEIQDKNSDDSHNNESEYSKFKKSLNKTKEELDKIKQNSQNRKEEIQKEIDAYGFLSVADCLSCHHRWVELGKQVDASFCPKCKETNKNKILVKEIHDANDLY